MGAPQCRAQYRFARRPLPLCEHSSARMKRRNTGFHARRAADGYHLVVDATQPATRCYFLLRRLSTHLARAVWDWRKPSAQTERALARYMASALPARRRRSTLRLRRGRTSTPQRHPLHSRRGERSRPATIVDPKIDVAFPSAWMVAPNRGARRCRAAPTSPATPISKAPPPS